MIIQIYKHIFFIIFFLYNSIIVNKYMKRIKKMLKANNIANTTKQTKNRKSKMFLSQLF